MKEDQNDKCSGCQGTKKCSRCEGLGYHARSVPAPITVIGGTVKREVSSGGRRTCSTCFGSGVCQICKGTGKASG